MLSVVNLLAWIADGQLRTIKKADVSNKQSLYSCDVYQCIINMECNSCRWINKENLPPTCMYKVFI